MFLLALAARGRFHYQMKPEDLAPFYVRGANILREPFAKMIHASDLGELADRAAGRAIDAVPAALRGTAESAATGVPLLEAMAWNRFWRVANYIFRASHMGLGAVVAFMVIRRVELANLITLSEAIRANVAPEVIRRRLIPRRDLEIARV